MTLEEFLALAKEAGMSVHAPSWGYSEHYHFAGYEDKIKNFAALVVAAEREAEKQEPFCYHSGRNIVGKKFAHHSDVFPLYTHQQPKREWVGLTDEEIEQGQKENWVAQQAFESAVWWAEAKLKEKNNG